MKRIASILPLAIILSGLLTLPAWGAYSAGLKAYQRHDYAAALRELKADNGKDAAYLLGIIYFKGEGVPADKKEALNWLRRAADKGHILAMNNIGVIYDKGDGVGRDVAEAAKWYRKAADKGHTQSQFNLGLMYTNGEGVPKDKGEAVKWLRKAAKNGHLNAKKLLRVMGEQ